MEKDNASHGIYHFEQSGFFKSALEQDVFPKSIHEYIKVENPAITALYHIGSLGTFTQGVGSDFDYWVLVDQKRIGSDEYAALKKKLDNIEKFSREKYHQPVTFFIMDTNSIADDTSDSVHPDEIIAIPRIFLKEEFYRTYLMIAGKIPLWSVLPLTGEDRFERQRMTRQVLSTHDDFIDTGFIHAIPFSDILKGLLWHVCKSVEDPMKALIKATHVFSYGFGSQKHKTLLCEIIKQGYSDAGIDDYSADPYKALFDRILDFHKMCDPDGIHLIKNAIFFRLCEYPNVKMPQKGSPKHQLLTHYIRFWKLKQHQINKLLSYSSWSESEKLLLEKAVIRRLAQMFNQAMQKAGQPEKFFITKPEQANWEILKNKTRMRLLQQKSKIPPCSTFLKRQPITRLVIEQTPKGWHLLAGMKDDSSLETIYTHHQFVHLFGWLLENGIYRRHSSQLKGRTAYRIFDTQYRNIGFDTLYLAASPAKPLSDTPFLTKPVYNKLMIFLFFSQNNNSPSLVHAELLSINSWGEIFTDTVTFDGKDTVPEKLTSLVDIMSQRADKRVRLYIYQFTQNWVPDIDYELKKKFEDLTGIHIFSHQDTRKPYLDRI